MAEPLLGGDDVLGRLTPSLRALRAISRVMKPPDLVDVIQIAGTSMNSVRRGFIINRTISAGCIISFPARKEVGVTGHSGSGNHAILIAGWPRCSVGISIDDPVQIGVPDIHE